MPVGGGRSKEDAPVERYAPPKAQTSSLGSGLTALLDTAQPMHPQQHQPPLPERELSVLEKLWDEGSTAGIWWL